MSADRSLVPSEGVDEGSAAATAESAEDHDDSEVVGAAPHGRPETEQDPAGPGDVPTDDVQEGVIQGGGPGQELAEGEG